MSEQDKMIYLLKGLTSALQEPDDVKKRRRTSVWGIACQYIGFTKAKQKDYDLIRNLTIEELVNKIENEG